MDIFNAVSLFDGISCGQVAFNKFNAYDYYRWYSSEIDEDAIAITQHNYPNTIQLGDIRNVRGYMIPFKVNLLLGGSPCQDLSDAGKKKGMSTINNIEITSLDQYMDLKQKGYEFFGQSHLFWEYLRIKEEIMPEYFILENVRMSEKWAKVISDALGVDYIKINSSLVSAQNRLRYYWTNIPNVKLPEDKGILLSDIMPGAVAGYGVRSGWDPVNRKLLARKGTTRKDGKSNTLVTGEAPTTKAMMIDGSISTMPIEVWEKLQTLPEGYTNVPGIGITKRKHAIGNGWTVDVIEHILSHIPGFNFRSAINKMEFIV